MGWLGWTEEQTLAMTPRAIDLARDGRADMINSVLQALFPPDPKAEAIAGQHEHKLAPTAANLKTVLEHMNGGPPRE